jgi:hypothetical protein
MVYGSPSVSVIIANTMVYGSPSVSVIIANTLALQSQKKIRFNYRFFTQKSAVILPQTSVMIRHFLNA